MSFFSEIYLSKFLGRPVYSADEKFYGVFKDFVVVHDQQSHNFKVTKLRVIPLREKKAVFINWNKVRSIETQSMVFKLKDNFSKIELSEEDETHEFRLKRDMLDQQIIDTNHHKVVRVNDLKLVTVKDEIYMVAADIGLRGLLRRIGMDWVVNLLSKWFSIHLEESLIQSKYIDPFPARIRHNIHLNVSHEKLNKLHPAELADIIEQLDHYEQISLLQKLDMDALSQTVAALEPKVRTRLISRFKDEIVSDVLENLNPDDATDIINDLPKRRMYSVLKMMKKEDAQDIEALIKFQKDTAGGMMNTEYVSLPSSMKVKDALNNMRKYASKAEVIFYLYIVNEEGKLIGAVSLRDLIFADEEATLKNLIRSKPIYVKIDDDIQDVVEHLTKYELIALPVVDNGKQIKGVITIEDVLKEVNPY